MLRSLLAALVVAVPALTTALPARAADPIIFAAASLKNALDDVSTAYLNTTGKTVAISYAGSSTLARQIEQGAPADIFISANVEWMDYLAERELIKADTRKTLLGNAIVIVVPKDSTATLAMAPGMDLAGLLGDGADGGRLWPDRLVQFHDRLDDAGAGLVLRLGAFLQFIGSCLRV